MPIRHHARAHGVSRVPAPRNRRADEVRILDRRSELIAEIAKLDEGGASRMTENARHLLTRWWAKAGWPAREQLLRTVQWLIEVERSRRSGAQASV